MSVTAGGSGMREHLLCGLMNQLTRKAKPKPQARTVKTAWGNVPTVSAYMRLKIVGHTTRARACSRPVAPSNCPTLSCGTCFVREDDIVGEPMPPKAATTPDKTKSGPVLTSA